MTAEQRAEMQALAKLPEASIDTSDIRELSDAEWATGERGRFFYKPIKTPATVRLDADVLAWLKSAGPGYQTRINAILREAMMRACRQDKR